MADRSAIDCLERAGVQLGTIRGLKMAEISEEACYARATFWLIAATAYEAIRDTEARDVFDVEILGYGTRASDHG